MATVLQPTPDTPVRDTPLPFHRPHLTEDECAAVLQALRSGWLTTGRECQAFERELAGYLAVPFAAALNSCTAGLHLGLLVAGVKPGDAVVTTPLTFCASVNVIEHVGARPVLVDVDPVTGCLDPAQLEGLPADLPVKVLLPVHYAGNACALDALWGWVEDRGATLLSDCAHALETRIAGRSLAELSDLAAYSFYATKNLTTGEGGCLTSHNPDWAERIARLRLHGMSADALRRYEPGQRPTYDVAEPGFKYNLTDPAAALGRLQLAAIEAHWVRRAEIVGAYMAGLAPLVEAEALRFLVPEPSAQTPRDRTAYHLCPIVLNPDRWGIDRDTAIAALQNEGICTSVHFTPVHRFSYYATKYGWREGAFPVAEAIGANEISLPLHPWLTPDEVGEVVEAFHRIWSRYRR
ncbi:MAG TPA: DegT/DnrJ/EryC1/StrS family aminotransferase [bacterium]|nr:DegT/DnrJ/EryC1/StrS family aminotransferase [bacterium]